MTSGSLEDLRTLLDAPSPAVLTTSRADGTAMTSPVWYRWTGLAFEIVIAQGDVKLKHLKRNPHCSLVVFETIPPFRGVEVRGEAILTNGDLTEARTSIATRYLGREAGQRFALERASSPGVLVQLLPERSRVWDLADIIPQPGSPPPQGTLRGLLEAGVLLASELSLPVLLRRLVQIAMQITEARYGALGVIGADGTIVEFINLGLSEEERLAIGPLPTGRGILGALIRDQKPLRLARLQDDPRSVGFPVHHPPMTTFLGAPVRARDKVFGNLYLTEKQSDTSFTAADEAAVVTLATQAGVAIANAQLYRELERRDDWLGALHEITTDLLAGDSQEGLLTAIVRSARELIHADLAAIALPVEPGSSTLRVVAADGIGSAALLMGSAKVSGTASHSVLNSGSPLILRPRSGDLYASFVADAGLPVGVRMVVPLRGREAILGTIILSSSEDDPAYDADALMLLESFASQATLAIEYLRAQEQVRQLAVAEERRRIARDLHDEPVQALIYLSRRLESMAMEPNVQAPAAKQLEQTRELAVAVADGLRQLTEGLRSEILDQEGLPAALHDLGRRFMSKTGVEVEVTIRGPVRRWAPELERSFLRVAQEALSNVERHAVANRLRLDLIVRSGRLKLRIADDGVGFEVRGVHQVAPGLGTIGMRERLQLTGGCLRIWSRPGRGTVVVATSPEEPLIESSGNHAASTGDSTRADQDPRR
ncbi:MAG: GAF domain-containing protein [Candidatus Dormiibacterota bacterium]